MGVETDSDLTGEEGRTVARRIREELARRRMSRQRLADEARLSLSTLEKALAGSRPFTLATTIRLEQALGVALRPGAPSASSALPGVAPVELGAYTRRSVSWLEGDYLTLRHAFGVEGEIYAYRTEIRWDEPAACLVFSEAGRTDPAFTQRGLVSVPTRSGHIYLVTNDQGQFRIALLGRPTISGEMYGLLSTLVSGPGSQLTPAASPLALLPTAGLDEVALGRIEPGHRLYERYRGHVQRAVDGGFARFFVG